MATSTNDVAGVGSPHFDDFDPELVGSNPEALGTLSSDALPDEEAD